MDKYEYTEKLAAIHARLATSKARLAKEYAFSNNDISEGDLVTDHVGTVLVDAVRVAISGGSDVPQCVYSGISYTKQGKPSKRGDRRSVWQCNLVTK